MRERLVELINSYPCMSTAEDCFMESISDDLADYLIANGVVVLPCKVGDSCYPLDASETKLTCEEKISRITISEKNIIIGY